MSLISRVDSLFRSSKQIKRQLRARNYTRRENFSLLVPSLEEPSDNIDTDVEETDEFLPKQFLIECNFFENRMDELSKIQLSMEEIRQEIRVSKMLFPSNRTERILLALSYVDKYFCDIVEDYERRKSLTNGRYYKVDLNVPYIFDFLSKRWTDKQFRARRSELYKSQDIDKEFDLLLELIQMANDNLKRKKRHGWRRTKIVSDDCLRFALWDMRLEVIERIERRKLFKFSQPTRVSWDFGDSALIKRSAPRRQAG